MVVELEQPGAQRPVRQLGVPVKLTRTPGEHARLPGPALGEHTEAGAARGRATPRSEIAELLARRRGRLDQPARRAA